MFDCYSGGVCEVIRENFWTIFGISVALTWVFWVTVTLAFPVRDRGR